MTEHASGTRPDRVAHPWGRRTPYAPDAAWPEREYLVDGRVVGVRGQAEDRLNRGRLGPKGRYGWQGVTGEAGLGTPHLDRNTRLCTATAAAALNESFGTDGQPARHAEVDHCDTLMPLGHDVAGTQTVLRSRTLDRLTGPDTGPPTHATQIFRCGEQDFVRLLWSADTNAAVSLSQLDRMRHILGSDKVLVVASDSWLTETADLSEVDTERLGVTQGDVVRPSTHQGSVELPARVVRTRPGTLFVPSHRGRHAAEAHPGDGRTHVANELTATDWAPVSTQPVVKLGGLRVERVGAGTAPTPAPELGAARRDESTPPGATAAGSDRSCT